MSAMGQKQTSAHVRVMSALPPKADIGTEPRNVHFVPKADILQRSKMPVVHRANTPVIECSKSSDGSWRGTLGRPNQIAISRPISTTRAWGNFRTSVMRTELRAIAAKMASCQRGMRLRGALIQIKDSTPITPNQCPLSRIKRTSSRPGEMSAFTARFAERPARRTSCQNHHVKLTDAVSETRRN